MGKGKKRSKKKAKPEKTDSDGRTATLPAPAPRPSSGGATEAACAAKDAPVANRECIVCDNCGVANPQKCCSQCLCAYYCSKECQIENWKKQHKKDCADLKKQRDLYDAAHDNSNFPDGTSAVVDGPCAICLEEEVKHPVTFECGHAFCFGCIVTYQRKEDHSSCPYCRGEIPDVLDKAADRLGLYVKRALDTQEESEERKKYCQLAMAEYDALSGLPIPLPMRLKSHLYLKAIIISLSKNPEELLKVTEEILFGIQGRDLELLHKEVVCAKLWRAQAYSEMGKWIHASQIYSELREEGQLGDYRNEFMLKMGHCRCLFELGDYDKAVEYGIRAVRMGRANPGVHEYLARAQKAAGNIDAAKKTMSVAILHEVPWNVENLKRNKQVLRDL